MPIYGETTNSNSLKKEKKQSALDQILNFQIGTPSDHPTKIKVGQKDLLIFFRQLSVILQSGVPLAQGLELLAENMSNKNLAKCVNDISQSLASGEELSICLKKYPKVFAPITVGLIEAGEAGGILSKVLNRIAKLLEASQKLKGQITGALIYPIIVLALAVTISLALLIFIVPRFEQLFSGLGAELPALTSTMLLLSRIVTSPGFLLGTPALLLTFSYLLGRYYSTKNGRLVIDTIILRVPLFGLLILRSEIASMCDTLCILVNSGIPLVEGLERCLGASNNEVIRRSIRNGMSIIQQGQELSYAFSLSKVMPRLLVSMVKIGEETGALPLMLDNLASFYTREVEDTVSAITKAMEPTVVVVVAGIVGTIVVSLYLPMFSLITEMG